MQHGRRPARASFRVDAAAIAVSRLLVACLFLALCNPAQAQPRNSTEAGGPMVPDVEPDVWLRRLAGRYEVEGAIYPVAAEEDEECADEICQPLSSTSFKPRTFRGKIDCVAIGSGPGVQCMLNIKWLEEMGAGGEPIPVSYLDPSMMLLGLDPQHRELNKFLVDNHGLGEGGAGRIRGNRAEFFVPCTNARVDNTPAATCERITRFEARPDARVVHVWIDMRDSIFHDPIGTQIMMTLRRTAEDNGE